MNSNEEMTNALTPGDEDDEIESQGFIDRVINVYLDPHTLFKYLTVKPDFWTPWIIVGLLMILITAFTYPVSYDLGMNIQLQTMEQKGDDEETIADTLMMAEKMQTVLMIIAVVLVSVGAVYMVKKKTGWVGIGSVIAFIMLAVIVHFIRKAQGKESLL